MNFNVGAFLPSPFFSFSFLLFFYNSRQITPAKAEKNLVSRCLQKSRTWNEDRAVIAIHFFVPRIIASPPRFSIAFRKRKFSERKERGGDKTRRVRLTGVIAARTCHKGHEIMMRLNTRWIRVELHLRCQYSRYSTADLRIASQFRRVPVEKLRYSRGYGKRH